MTRSEIGEEIVAKKTRFNRKAIIAIIVGPLALLLCIGIVISAKYFKSFRVQAKVTQFSSNYKGEGQV